MDGETWKCREKCEPDGKALPVLSAHKSLSTYWSGVDRNTQALSMHLPSSARGTFLKGKCSFVLPLIKSIRWLPLITERSPQIHEGGMHDHTRSDSDLPLQPPLFSLLLWLPEFQLSLPTFTSSCTPRFCPLGAPPLQAPHLILQTPAKCGFLEKPFLTPPLVQRSCPWYIFS